MHYLVSTIQSVEWCIIFVGGRLLLHNCRCDKKWHLNRLKFKSISKRKYDSFYMYILEEKIFSNIMLEGDARQHAA